MIMTKEDIIAHRDDLVKYRLVEDDSNLLVQSHSLHQSLFSAPKELNDMLKRFDRTFGSKGKYIS